MQWLPLLGLLTTVIDLRTPPGRLQKGRA